MPAPDAFKCTGLTIRPSELVAVSAIRRSSNTAAGELVTTSATPSSKGPPWLTLLPLSSRSDAAISYGALPGMKTRAEMFNRLAIGVNHLTRVRFIQPRVAQVTSTNATTTTFQRAPETNGVQNWEQGTVKFGGDTEKASYSLNEIKTSQSLSPAGAGFSMISEATVSKFTIADTRATTDGEAYSQAQLQNLRLKYGEIDALKAGLYIVSTYTTADVTIKYIDHPLSKKATAHLNLKNVTQGKLIIEKRTEKGSCSKIRADTEEDKPIKCRSYEQLTYQFNGNHCPSKTVLGVSSIPDTKKTYVTELKNTKTMTVSLRAEKKAEIYSIPKEYFWRDNSPSCESYESVNVKPVLINFSPQILKV